MKNLIIPQSISIKQSLNHLEKNKEKCLLVVSKKRILVGTLNDGDIRRAIIKGANVDSKIKNYVQKKPFYLFKDDLKNKKDYEISNLIEKKRKNHIDVIPILDKNKKIIDILSLRKKNINRGSNKLLRKVPLVIMAGGKGSRLKPFTDIFPKALIPINNVPAVEHIINHFRKNNVTNIFLTLNYKKELIKSYFADKKSFKLKYIEEKKELDTAGAIGLLKNKIKSDFFICNCDTLSKINIEKFFEYHSKGKFDITLVAAAKKHSLSYGSCKLDGKGNLKKIIEKPFTNHLVNIGLYLLKPSIITMVSGKETISMDQLITKAKKRKKKIGVFPVNENNWQDVGEWSENYKLVFNV